MPRAALLALLVASLLGGPLQAQRAAAFRGSAAARSDFRSGFVRQGSFPNRFVSGRSRHRQNNFGTFFLPYSELPYGEPSLEDQSDLEGNATAPPPAILQPRERMSEPRAAKPLVIEIPGAASSAAAKMVPPTIFILANGERLETRRFLLSAINLSVSIERQQRTVPIAMLDIDATISANRERGIDLRIPADRSEISLSF